MIVNCTHCGKEIARKPSHLKKRKNVFCSKECHNEFMRKGAFVQCSWCGKEIYKTPSQQTERNFCQQICRLKWLGKNNTENLNVPGHSAGHKAPHLTQMNRLRNPGCSQHKNEIYVPTSAYRPIVEASIGRKLLPTEIVHHINGDRTDNRLENLQVMSKQEHHRLHMKIAIERFNSGDKEVMPICQKRKPYHEE